MKLKLILILVGVLGAIAAGYFFIGQPEPEPTPETPPLVWSVEMLELMRISISLPPQELSLAWVKGIDKQWYFDEPAGPQVLTTRWGGGVPLILSGPRANRLILQDATTEQLDTYGLVSPRMTIQLDTESNKHIEIEVGDRTPNGQNYYVKLAESSDVYSVDYTWYDVLERLVLDPPYPTAD